MQRRTFLIGCGLATGAGALLVGWALQDPDRLGSRSLFNLVPGETALNGWVRVAADGTITVAVPRADLGQGIGSALAMLVAEELDLPWEQVRVEHPPQDPVYANTTMLIDGMALLPAERDGHWALVVRRLAANGMHHLGLVATGGSTSVRDGWLPLRTAGAGARTLLLQAAAARWEVAVEGCSVVRGQVVHAASGRRAGFGELAPAAARLSLQQPPRLRERGEWRLIGHSPPRLDIPAKVSGAARYGIDTVLPGQLYAAVRLAPHPDGEVTRLVSDAALAAPGVRAVVRIPGGVAVIADQWWRAHRALDRLEVEFSAPAPGLAQPVLRARYRELAESGSAHTHRREGDQDRARSDSGGPGGQVLTRDFELPYLAHGALEPLNCTARIADGKCEVWAGHQVPTLVRWLAAEASGLPVEQVVYHALPAGGSFGRRLDLGLVTAAVQLAAHLPGQPVKLLWTREDDTRHDAYRPMALVRHRVALDARGEPTAWHIRVVSASIVQSILQRSLPWAASPLAPDQTAVDGALELPYAVAALRVEHVAAPSPLPLGFWRSVGHSINAFAVEAMVDELAHAAGQDPLRYRERLLAGQPRHLRALRAAAHAAAWGEALPPGAGRGIAVHAAFGSVLGLVVTVAPGPAGLRVTRMTAAVDCGTALDPRNVEAQVEGGLLFALSASLGGDIHFEQGVVRESNFHELQPLRIADCPAVEVQILDAPDAPPGGIGEVAGPPVAAALAAALFAATGRRQRTLPLALGSVPAA